MRICKRSFLYIRKHIVKSLIVMAVMTIVLTLLLSSRAISSGVDSTTEAAKKNMKPNVELSVDYTKLYGDPTEHHDRESEGNKTSPLNEKAYEEIKKSKYVKNAYAEISTFTMNDLKVYEKESNSDVQGGVQISGNGDANGEFVTPSNQIKSLQDDGQNAFAKTTSKLTDGVMPYDSDVENPLLMNKKQADENNLKIGDTVEMTRYAPVPGKTISKKTKFTIVGIYENVSNKSNGMDGMPGSGFMSENNVMYTSFEAAKDLATVELDDSESFEFEAIKVELNSVEDVKKFTSELESNKNIETDSMRITSDVSKYEEITKNVQAVSDTSQTIMLVSSGAAIAILALVITLSLKDRKYEIGVLLSLGEKKFAMISQIVVETIVIAVISFGIALALSGSVAESMSTSLLEANQEDTTTTDGNQMIIMDPNGMREEEETKEIDEISINAYEVSNIALVAGMGFTIVFVASLLPTLVLLRKNPKAIMLREE